MPIKNPPSCSVGVTRTTPSEREREGNDSVREGKWKFHIFFKVFPSVPSVLFSKVESNNETVLSDSLFSSVHH